MVYKQKKQLNLKQQLKKLLENQHLCVVVWSDIKTYLRQDKNDLELPTNLMMESIISYGVIGGLDKHGIYVVTEDSHDEVDFTVIPLSVITYVEDKETKGGK